jgi:hypothetical protein
MPRPLQFALAAFLVVCPGLGAAQEPDAPLGDVARQYRKAKPADEENVINNENLPLVMDKAEAERLNGQPVFSIDPSGKTFRMSSPDGSCSLSFDARATALISTPYVSSSLPLDELARLDGTAAIHDGVIEVSVHNGTAWELKEIVVGVTVLSERGTLLKSANLLGPTESELVPRTPDVTLLYHLKAASAPDSMTVFRGSLDQDFGPAIDWHWALVGARGVPPAAPKGPPSLTSPATAANLTSAQPPAAPGGATAGGVNPQASGIAEAGVQAAVPNVQPKP